jgi:hypothetical protein
VISIAAVEVLNINYYCILYCIADRAVEIPKMVVTLCSFTLRIFVIVLDEVGF